MSAPIVDGTMPVPRPGDPSAPPCASLAGVIAEPPSHVGWSTIRLVDSSAAAIARVRLELPPEYLPPIDTQLASRSHWVVPTRGATPERWTSPSGRSVTFEKIERAVSLERVSREGYPIAASRAPVRVLWHRECRLGQGLRSGYAMLIGVDAPRARLHDRVAAYWPLSDGRWLTMLASSRDSASVGELLAIARSVTIERPADTAP